MIAAIGGIFAFLGQIIGIFVFPLIGLHYLHSLSKVIKENYIFTYRRELSSFIKKSLHIIKKQQEELSLNEAQSARAM